MLENTGAHAGSADNRFPGGKGAAQTPAPGSFEDVFSKAKILAAVKGDRLVVEEVGGAEAPPTREDGGVR